MTTDSPLCSLASASLFEVLVSAPLWLSLRQVALLALDLSLLAQRAVFVD